MTWRVLFLWQKFILVWVIFGNVKLASNNTRKILKKLSSDCIPAHKGALLKSPNRQTQAWCQGAYHEKNLPRWFRNLLKFRKLCPCCFCTLPKVPDLEWTQQIVRKYFLFFEMRVGMWVSAGWSVLKVTTYFQWLQQKGIYLQLSISIRTDRVHVPKWEHLLTPGGYSYPWCLFPTLGDTAKSPKKEDEGSQVLLPCKDYSHMSQENKVKQSKTPPR